MAHAGRNLESGNYLGAQCSAVSHVPKGEPDGDWHPMEIRAAYERDLKAFSYAHTELAFC